MTTDTSEKGLETLIVRHMTGVDGFTVTPGSIEVKPSVTGAGYFAGAQRTISRPRNRCGCS